MCVRRPSLSEPRGRASVRRTAAPAPPRPGAAGGGAPAGVVADPTPEMGSEDFAYMLQAKPGCYVWLGAGKGPEPPGLHSPYYDFNDEVLAIGASYWVTLAEQPLPAGR